MLLYSVQAAVKMAVVHASPKLQPLFRVPGINDNDKDNDYGVKAWEVY